MLIDKLINTVYAKTKDIVLKDIKDKDKKEIAKSYLNYLYKLYLNNEVTEERYEKLLSIILDTEKRKWQSISSERKMQYLIHDDSFYIICDLSGKAFRFAQEKNEKKCKNTVSKEEASNNIDTLIKELNNVKEFNKDVAKQIVSEGILDYNYACGNNDNIISFRLSHAIEHENIK